MKDFPVTATPFGQEYIRWNDIERMLGEENFKQFCDWMQGQTTPLGGVYPYDLNRWLQGLPCVD